MRDQPELAGSPIARGNTSDIWPWTPTTVLKLLHADIPRHWASIEADILWRVRQAGLPVPALDGVVEVDGRIGIILERIDGETMWERMRADPSSGPDLVGSMVDLQVDMHATSVEGLPDLSRRLGSKIDEAVQITARDRRLAQSLLADRPTGDVLCHGDVHPANVVLSPRGPVIVDWFDAASGPAEADIVRSSLLMRPPLSMAAWPEHLTGAEPRSLEAIHCAYIGAVTHRGLIDATTFAAWEPVVAVARMSERVRSDDLVALWRRWRADGASPTMAMVEHCVDGAGG